MHIYNLIPGNIVESNKKTKVIPVDLSLTKSDQVLKRCIVENRDLFKYLRNTN